MKKNALSLIAIALAIVLGILFYTTRQKIGYVDTNLLMGKYKAMDDARAEFEKKAAVWQSNTDTLLMDWQNELKNYEKERTKMTKKEKELKEELLRNKQQQINQYQEAMQMKAREEEQKLTQTVINEVNDYISEYGKKHGYDFILGATGSGNIVFASDTRDLTDVILEGLNKEYNRRGE